MSAPDEAALVRFVYDEARLIDEKRWAEWYELYTDDAYYWMPLTRGQPDGENHTSLLYEDKLLLRVRIERLAHPHSYSQQPPSYCQHVLQQPQLESSEGGVHVMRTAFVYVESQADRVVVLAGIVRHHIVALDGQLRLRLKKVELINCDAPLPAIQLFP